MSQISKNARKSALRHWLPKVAAVAAPLLLIILAVLHALFPTHVLLDWQTVALLVFGVVLVFLPMRDIAAMIQSLELGKFKILLKATDQLEKTTARAEVDVIEQQTKEDDKQDIANLHIAAKTGHEPKRASKPIESDWSDFEPLWKILSEVNELRAVSNTAALVRLATSIEATVITLASKVALFGMRPDSPKTFRQALLTLTEAKVIPSSLAEGLSQFMDLRNKVVHSHMRKGLQDEVVKSAIENGILLVRMLLSIASPFNIDPVDGETVSLQ